MTQQSQAGDSLIGVLLAAGAGRRMGGPKALLRHPIDDTGPSAEGQPWVVRAARVLLDGGCARVLIVLGAEAAAVISVVEQAFPDDARLRWVLAADWAEGMGASLRAALGELSAPGGQGSNPRADAALITLVDTPGVTAAVVRRLVVAVDDWATGGRSATAVLARAGYSGRPGHPVVIGRDHWDEVRRVARADAGARAYLRARPDVLLIECSDVGDGRDVDEPGDLDGPSG